MPELTEITNETPAKVEETEARIEDDDDDDSDTTIPELEDTGMHTNVQRIRLTPTRFIVFFSVLIVNVEWLDSRNRVAKISIWFYSLSQFKWND